MNISTKGYKSSLLVSEKPATLYGIAGFNNGADQFIQLHDSNIIPADGSVPELTFKIYAGSNFSLDYGRKGRVNRSGIALCVSSIAETLATSADDCFFDAQFK